MKKIRSDAEQALRSRGRYQIEIKIGIARYTFAVCQYGAHGFTLRKNDEIVDEYPDQGRVLTALYTAVEFYV